MQMRTYKKRVNTHLNLIFISFMVRKKIYTLKRGGYFIPLE